ncbi:acyl-CoA dehydrogenase family protein [Rubrivirga sp.]|uniref:acyl-CoA dehydrogenase family protein n=1 Tax=Rubrivirga sp. TaxID=1885344 RepID=UPI003B523E96
MPTTVLDTDLLDRLSRKIDVDKVLRGLDAMPEEHLARLLAATDGPAEPKEPREPDPDFYGLFDRQLSDEQQRVRRVVRRFMVETVEPVANGYWERGEMPFELVQPLAAMLREALGETPAERYCTDPFVAGLVSLEIPRVDPSLGTFLGVHWGLCLVSIHLFGSDAQKARWLGPLERFEKIGSWALTEPAHGSDAAAGLETTATRTGDTWTITGAKKWSGNATFADVTVIWAKDTADGEVKGFLVEKETPGFEVTKLEGKIAKRAVQNVDIRLDGVEVPESSRLPGVRSFRDVAGQLATARAGVAWEAVGMAMGIYEHTHRYCTRRVQFGKPIAGFQLVQESLVRMLGNVVAVQAVVLGLGHAYDEPHRLHERASLAKVFCVDKMRETAQIGRGLLGGNGILLEHHVARLFADAEAVYSYEGSREMNALIVGRAITGLSAFV